MMLGKVQFELQKFVDSYRSNIIYTITTPSESLLKELQTVEEMKQQCDMKREAYEATRASYREKGRSRHSKTETYSAEQLQSALAEYQEDAALFIFRLKSLRQGQFHSLLTQASRHHAAQLSFFRRGLKCLEALEPHVKAIAERQHIDYQFSGLEDDESDNDDYSSDQDDCSEDGELSFDYEINDKDQDFLASGGSMDLDKRDVKNSPQPVKESMQEEVKQTKGNVLTPRVKPELNAHSGNLQDPSERLWQMKPSSAKHSYKLPMPVDDKQDPRPVGAPRSHHSQQLESKPRVSMNPWHSSPLTKDFRPGGHVKTVSSTEATSTFSQSVSGYKKTKRESWSGPIPSRPGLSKPSSLNGHRSPPMAHLVTPGNLQCHSRQPSVSPKVSPKMLPHPTRSPTISELHELPRPPANVESLRPSGLIGYSGPLVPKRQTEMPAASQTPSPLPLPPATLTRSYSIPSNSQRIPIITVDRLLEARNSRDGSDNSSPPLTPLSLADLSQQQGTKTSTSRTRIKGAL
ncbi:hydroxyproline-rich glycoprotein family protein [Zea mays]|nr:hydroxyproline-rich glycoprotein family protein [Zea mays]